VSALGLGRVKMRPHGEGSFWRKVAALDGVCICSHAPVAGEKPDLLAN